MRRASRFLALFLAILLILPSAVACARPPKDGRMHVVCTTFAAYDWCQNIVGDRADVELLISDGSDLHGYEPTVSDKVRLLESDLVVYLGGESDAWVLDMLESEADIDVHARTLCLSEVEGVVLREPKRSSEDEHDHEHEHVHTEGDGHDHAFDEHLWLSLENAIVCTRAIGARVSVMDKAGRDEYAQNVDTYCEKLSAMSEAYAASVAEAKNDRLLVADRNPFVYVAEDYGLAFCAAFEGCTTESEASFDTIVRLSQKADEWQSRYVIVTEGSDQRLAKSVIASSQKREMEILPLNSMQSVTKRAMLEGQTYLSVMEENLNILRLVLS